VPRRAFFSRSEGRAARSLGTGCPFILGMPHPAGRQNHRQTTMPSREGSEEAKRAGWQLGSLLVRHTRD
jgi:hypothetical protein